MTNPALSPQAEPWKRGRRSVISLEDVDGVSVTVEKLYASAFVEDEACSDEYDSEAIPHTVSASASEEDFGSATSTTQRRSISSGDGSVDQQINDLKGKMFSIRFKHGKPTPAMVSDISALASKVLKLEDELIKNRASELAHFEEVLQLGPIGLKGVFTTKRVSSPDILSPSGMNVQVALDATPVKAPAAAEPFLQRSPSAAFARTTSSRSTADDSTDTHTPLRDSVAQPGAAKPRSTILRLQSVGRVNVTTADHRIAHTAALQVPRADTENLDQLTELRQQVRAGLLSLKRKPHLNTSAMQKQLRDKLVEIDGLIKVPC
eukprot:TRINITY_DN7767_c0_g1_i2.p1 TRINITY_DN7767_c0_g1~~TRINITY_DN7767_c0_g1_i2.p1  ORF type:complete len:320 (+),score=53.47 TRINITY_DN7767_c0_g1_i2:144-1103(+)